MKVCVLFFVLVAVLNLRMSPMANVSSGMSQVQEGYVTINPIIKEPTNKTVRAERVRNYVVNKDKPAIAGIQTINNKIGADKEVEERKSRVCLKSH